MSVVRFSSDSYVLMTTRRYTGYIKKVTSSLQTMGPGQRILDIPAGYGQFAEELRRLGHVRTKGL